MLGRTHTDDHQNIDLENRLSTLFEPFRRLQDRQDFIAASHKLDSLQELFILLAKTNVNHKPWNWLTILSGLMELSSQIASHLKNHRGKFDTQLTLATALYNKSLALVMKFLESFYRNITIETLEGIDFGLFISFTLESANYAFLINGIVNTNALVQNLSLCCSKYLLKSLEEAGSDLEPEARLEIVRLMIGISKAALYGGCPSAILPLVFSQPACLSETFIIPIVGNECFSIELLIDYFRYGAYCLVSTVAEHDKIEDSFTKKADIFLKVLLNLPNLQLTNYLEKEGEMLVSLFSKYVTLTEREELSFFYLINFLMKSRSLEDLTDSEKNYVAELTFFVNAFNRHTAYELDQLASVPLSRNGSYVSVPKAAEPSTQALNVETFATMSSILHDGSYKERLKLVVDFFKQFMINSLRRSFSGLSRGFDLSTLHLNQDAPQLFSSNNELLSLINRIDSEKFPGKFLYLKAVDKIVRLVQLLSLKFFLCTAGLAQSPQEILGQYIVSRYSLDQILLVKDILATDGTILITRSTDENAADSDIQHQIELVKRTRALESSFQRLF